VDRLIVPESGLDCLSDTISGPAGVAPATPKRERSAQHLSELVRHPMAAAAAAVGGTMAAHERESFPQLCAEASEGRVGSVTGTALANGTPSASGAATPDGSHAALPAVVSAFAAAGKEWRLTAAMASGSIRDCFRVVGDDMSILCEAAVGQTRSCPAGCLQLQCSAVLLLPTRVGLCHLPQLCALHGVLLARQS